MRKYSLLLKYFAQQKDLCQGIRVHADVVKLGFLDQDIYVGSSLVNMYAKCGSLEEAQEVFDRLPIQNVVAWTSLIEGYSHHGYNEEALKCFEYMQCKGIFPDAFAFICILKACGNIRDAEKGQEIHSQIIKGGGFQEKDEDTMLGTALVDMYIKCGMIMKAQVVFDELRIRDVVSWSVLITGYAKHGDGQKALDFFEQMQREGVLPDVVTFLSILKACGSIRSLDKGQKVHGEIIKEGLLFLDKGRLIGTALVDMYGKCGALEKAQEVFDNLKDRDEIAWNVLIANYAEHEHAEEALKWFKSMSCEGLSPDAATFVSVLKACGSINIGKEVHAKILSQPLVRNNIMVGNALVDMYAKCGELTQAQDIFSGFLVRDVTCWNTIMTGNSQYGQDEEALHHFGSLQHESILPNMVTYFCILKSCGNLGEVEKGKMIHARLHKENLFDKEILLQNELIHMYAKCGALLRARKVLEEVKIRDIVSWTALISGYAQERLVEEVFGCLKQMQHEGQWPNEVTIICILKACSSTGALDKGIEMHEYISRERMWEQNTQVCNALVDMYSKCNMLTKAQEVFDELLVRDIVSWTTLLSGYAQQGHGEEALQCFERMHCETAMPNVVTLVCMLKASGSIGAINRGREIHSKIINGQLQGVLVGNALVDMYAKCGIVEKAQTEFNEIQCQNVVSWTALIAGYGHLGYDEMAIELFNKMIGEGVEPNAVTFSVVLNACSHSGLLDMGQLYFESMSKCYNIIPTSEHYTSMVDLFGRIGLFEHSIALIEKIPTSDYLPTWTALLGSCQRLGNIKLGKLAFDYAVQLDETNSVPYVCMRNIYATVHVEEDTNEIEASDRYAH